MAIVSDIEIRLAANIAALRQDMEQARRTVGGAMDGIRDSVNTATKALGALAVGMAAGAFAGWIKGAIDATDAVSDISQRTGIAIKDIAGLQMWFQKGGTEAKTFESAMIKLSKKIADGGKEFDNLGIKTRDANGNLRGNVEVLLDSADAFAAMQDGTAKTAAAVGLFGEEGAKLIPLLNEGSEGLREMNEMAEKLGLTFDENTVEAAGQFNDTLDLMGAASQGVARQVAAQLLPTLNSLTGSMFEFITAGNGVQNAAAVIGTGFKLIYTAGVLVSQAFNVMGKTLGALAAQMHALFQLEFKQAINIGHAWQADMKDVFSSTAKTIGDTWSGAGGEVVEALVKTTSAGTVAAASSDKAAKAAKQQADAYHNLIDAIQGKITESDREAMGVAKLTESQKLAMSLDKSLADGKVKLTAAEEGYYRMLIETLGASEQAAEVSKEVAASNARAAKGAEDVAKLLKQVSAERDKDVETAIREAEAQEELARTFDMSKTALAELAVVRAQENLEQAKSAGEDYDEIQRLEKIIEARQRAAAAIARTDDLQKQKDLWKSIEDTAHQTFISIADGGKDAATRLKDTFKNIFFEWLYQQTLKKWIINLEGNASMSSGGGALSSLAGMFGGGSTGGGVGSGILGGASNLLSIGKSIYQGFSGGVASSLGTMITQLGTTFGSSAVASFGAGMSGTAGATGAAASAGASAASAIPVIGWIIAGMNMSNSLYKQGWDFNNGSVNKLGQNLGSGINLVDQLARKLGFSDKTANIISGLAPVSKLFGRKNPEIESQGARLSFDSAGAFGHEFAKILEKGGVFRSDKRYERTANISDDFASALSESFLKMTAVTGELGKVIGVTGVNMADFSKSLEIVWDKDATKREQQVADMLAGLGNDLATYLVPSIATFAKSGEVAATTLQRLATEVAATDAIMSVMGVTSQQAFGAVGIASIAARERLIEFAGGIESLASQVDFFNANFLTDAERMAPVQKQLADQMAALGYASVDTNEEFKALVQGLASSGALATESGAKTYAALLALAPAFKQVTDYTKQLTAAQEDAAEQMAATLAQGLRDAAGSAFDTLQRSINARRASVQDAFSKVMADLEDRIGVTGNKINSLTGLASLLAGTRTGMAGMGRSEGQAQIQAALAIAKASGVLPSADSLRDALSAVSQDAQDQFSSFVDYQRDALLTQNAIEELAGITDTELSVAQRTLAALQDQKTAAQAAYDREIARLDEMLSKAQMQIDAINGVNNSVLSMVEAFGQFASAISAALSNPTIGGQASVGPVNQIESLYNSLLGRNSDASGMKFYQDQLAAGVSLDWIRQEFMNSPEYLNKIYTPQQSGRMMASGTDQQQINAEMQAALNRTASAVEQMANQIDQVTGGGNAMLTETV